MHWIFIVLIVVVSISILGVMFYIFQFKKEEVENDFVLSKERLDALAEEIELLKFLAKENASVYDRLASLQEKIQFSTPSEKREVEKFDDRIASYLGDLKISLARAQDKGSYHSANRIITQIELLLIERENKVKK
jgi:flagellar basal body-associated protein FliL